MAARRLSTIQLLLRSINCSASRVKYRARSLADALELIKMLPGRRDAALLQIMNPIDQPPRQRQRQAGRGAVAGDRPELLVDLGAAAADHDVAPDPAALLLVAPTPLHQRVERPPDRGPVALLARVVERRLDAVKCLGPNAQAVGDLVDLAGQLDHQRAIAV